jgi:hypothetical protein
LCFKDRVLQTTCPSWLWTIVLLISSSQVARIAGMNHQHLARVGFWKHKSINFS